VRWGVGDGAVVAATGGVPVDGVGEIGDVGWVVGDEDGGDVLLS